jgi:nucleotide-binding universal stress UspA family protein
MFKKMAVALDGSHSAEEALEVAFNLARSERAELAICSVIDPIMIAGTAPPSPAMEVVIDDMERFARKLVAGAVERAGRSGITATGETRCGAPAFEILKYAADVGADAIVMGTHGRSGLKHFLMGSVAETLLREAKVPVIVVRERERERSPVHS